MAYTIALFLYFIFQLSYGQGTRYNGEYSESPALQHVGKSNFVIEGLEISGNDAYTIALYSCENVIIKNNRINSSPVRPAIYLDNCRNITIVDNSFYDVQSALIAHKSQMIRFEYNDVINILGSLQGGKEIGNMVQFDKVSGAGNSISYNVCENLPGKSAPEDIINVYHSHGTPGSPITVKGNWIRGGGPSLSGGGIILGDLGGSYQVAEDNIVVDGGQYGVSIAGGDNMILRNNKIFGRQKEHANIGLYVANWYEEQGKSHSIRVENNVVNFTNREGKINNWWFAGNMEPVYGKKTNRYDINLDASILPDTIIGRVCSRRSSLFEESVDNNLEVR